MSSVTPFQLDVAALRLRYGSSDCARRTWLRARGVHEEPDSDPIADALWSMVERDAADEIARRTSCTDLRSNSRRGAATLEAIGRCDEVIAGPLFRASAYLAGTERLLVSEPTFLVRRPNGYAIQQMVPKLPLEAGGPDELGIQLAGLLYRQITGEAAGSLQAILASARSKVVEDDDGEAVLNRFRQICREASSDEEPSDPVEAKHCDCCGYRDRCIEIAAQAGDIALVPGLGRATVRAPRAAGLRSLDDLGGATEATLRRARLRSGKEAISREEAPRVLRQVAVLRSGRAELIERPNLPRTDEFAILDFEYLSAALTGSPGGPPRVLVWGCGLYGTDDPVRWTVIVEDDDREAWFKFLTALRPLLRREADALPFVHFASPEPVIVGQYLALYGDTHDSVASRLLGRTCDLYKALKRAVVLPVSDYGQKSIERYLGVNRASAHDGKWAAGQLLRAVCETDGSAQQRILEQVARYNLADLDGAALIQKAPGPTRDTSVTRSEVRARLASNLELFPSQRAQGRLQGPAQRRGSPGRPEPRVKTALRADAAASRLTPYESLLVGLRRYGFLALPLPSGASRLLKNSVTVGHVWPAPRQNVAFFSMSGWGGLPGAKKAFQAKAGADAGYIAGLILEAMRAGSGPSRGSGKGTSTPVAGANGRKSKGAAARPLAPTAARQARPSAVRGRASQQMWAQHLAQKPFRPTSSNGPQAAKWKRPSELGLKLKPIMHADDDT